MLIITFLFTIGSHSSIAQPTKESLLPAWENIQKSDPKTLVFDKIAEDRYKFKTEHFPFEGELKVLNINIDDRWSDQEFGTIMGVIEIELVDLPEDFLQKHSYSYSIWSQNNMLYYDKKSEQWLSSKEYYALSQKKYNLNPFTSIFRYLPVDITTIIFIVIIIIIIFYLSKIQKKNEKYINNAQDMTKKSLELIHKSLALSEETNKLLKEIADLLKEKRT
jgi:hypothetical protein